MHALQIRLFFLIVNDGRMIADRRAGSSDGLVAESRLQAGGSWDRGSIPLKMRLVLFSNVPKLPLLDDFTLGKDRFREFSDLRVYSRTPDWVETSLFRPLTTSEILVPSFQADWDLPVEKGLDFSQFCTWRKRYSSEVLFSISNLSNFRLKWRLLRR
ncbi:hypothetical protein AVEN_11745-1 [Araneus ventricosus]|uniref:Uncharacterized protein n=1 Tax=Araneus ventricosus TaxID=182803 RepID=A0A4Y2EQR8_ARAVE|nr:hypothetical protein AVEN_11745-1 [Araneus ventricosus]